MTDKHLEKNSSLNASGKEGGGRGGEGRRGIVGL